MVKDNVKKGNPVVIITGANNGKEDSIYQTRHHFRSANGYILVFSSQIPERDWKVIQQNG